jgi:hypothetical protein
MKGRQNGIIKSLTRDNNWVYVELTTSGVVTSEVSSPDAKSSGAEIKLRIKPIMGDQLKFGDRLYFTWSTENPTPDDSQYA